MLVRVRVCAATSHSWKSVRVPSVSIWTRGAMKASGVQVSAPFGLTRVMAACLSNIALRASAEGVAPLRLSKAA